MPNSLLSPISFSSWFDSTTGEVVQADVYFYVAGTTDMTPVFHDANLSAAWEQPIRTTGNGRMPPVFVPEIPFYRIMVYDLDEVLLEEVDGLPGAEPDPATVADPIGTDQTALLHTGDIIAAFAGPDDERLNFVRCNGLTISNAAGTLSAGTEMQSDDAEDLFIFLWGVSDNNGDQLAVLPSKGASAAADWSNGKAITLPDLRGRAIVGLNDMGNTNAARLSSTYWGQTGLYPGQAGGVETHTLTTAQLAAHGHTSTQDWLYQDAHQHTFTSNNDHSHSLQWTSSTTQDGSATGLVNDSQVSGPLYYGNSVAVIGGPTSTGGISNVITGVSTILQPVIHMGLTINNSGSGSAHNNTQPSMTLMYYMRI